MRVEKSSKNILKEAEKLNNLLDKYKELELTISDLEKIKLFTNRNEIYRFSCYFRDIEGTPLKCIEGIGANIATRSIAEHLQKLTFQPYDVFKLRIEDEPIVIADFYLDLPEVNELEDYLEILINFKNYIEQIEIADAKIYFDQKRVAKAIINSSN
jgi:hypothetical protein